MKKVTSKRKIENYYQIKIPADKYVYLLVLDSTTEENVIKFVKEHCSREFDVVYKGQSNTIIGRVKKRRSKKGS